jgi:hypothetical protein
MHSKLTLRIDEALIRRAKSEAMRRRKSVSQMVGEFITSLGAPASSKKDHPPLTASLIGVVKGSRASEASYKKHLRERYL